MGGDISNSTFSLTTTLTSSIFFASFFYSLTAVLQGKCGHPCPTTWHRPKLLENWVLEGQSRHGRWEWQELMDMDWSGGGGGMDGILYFGVWVVLRASHASFASCCTLVIVWTNFAWANFVVVLVSRAQAFRAFSSVTSLSTLALAFFTHTWSPRRFHPSQPHFI